MRPSQSASGCQLHVRDAGREKSDAMHLSMEGAIAPIVGLTGLRVPFWNGRTLLGEHYSEQCKEFVD